MSSKNVTRLFTSFQPEHYHLELEPDRASKCVGGSITITGKKRGRPSQRLTFHQHDLKITSATVTRHDKKGDQTIPVARINHQKTMDEVRLHAEQLLYGGAYTITMQFEGHIQDGMNGIYACDYEVDGKKQQLIATQFESHYARLAFPCIDEPEAKATFELTLISPKNEAAISNTPAACQIEKDGKLVTTFEITPKMSTYLLAFVYGDMQCKKVKTSSGTDARVWATKAHSPEALDFGLDVAKRAIEFFNDYYDVPYPLAKCDHVALPDFSVGAMENWGLITYRESCLLADPKTASQSSRERVALVMAHELSHQWFGDLVTMKWWDDLWLNESFANVMEYVAVDALFPEWTIWNSFIGGEGLSAIRRDCIAGVQAVKTGVHHPDEISSLFDSSIVYAKGGRLLNMLMQYLGKDDFRSGLKAYFTKHAYGNTTGSDLWAALGEASGKDVAAFMDPWIMRSGFPVVQVAQNGKELKISQAHFLLDAAKIDADRLWPVPLLSSNAEVPALLDTKQVDMTLATSEYVRINRGAVGHYIVQYTEPEHSAAVAELAAAKKLTVAERLMLLSDSSMLARAGVQPFPATLDLLAHYASEDSEPVWDIMALVLADGRRFIDSDLSLEAPMKAVVRTLIENQFQRLGWDEKPNESSDDTKLRATIMGLGIYAEHKQITKDALERFTAYQKDSAAVPAELRGIVFGAAVREAVPGAVTYLLGIEKGTSNVNLKDDIMGALTATRSEADATMLLGRLKDPAKVRQNVVDFWLVYLLRNRYTRTLAWKWLRDNWDWIEKTFSSDQTYDSFPRYAASAFSTRTLMEEYRTFFEPLKTQTSLERNITLGIEELENRVAWLERDLPGVQKHFKNK